MTRPLPREYYNRDTAQVARDLLGKVLIHYTDGESIEGRIVETEAYLGMVDPSSHIFNGFTPRTRGTWGHPGLAYLFTIHGHWCLNAITLSAWPYGCVLIRGVEGVPGPGRLTKHFHIDGDHEGKDLTAEDSCLSIREGEFVSDLLQDPRVGVSKGKDMYLRFRVRED